MGVNSQVSFNSTADLFPCHLSQPALQSFVTCFLPRQSLRYSPHCANLTMWRPSVVTSGHWDQTHTPHHVSHVSSWVGSCGQTSVVSPQKWALIVVGIDCCRLYNACHCYLSRSPPALFSWDVCSSPRLQLSTVLSGHLDILFCSSFHLYSHTHSQHPLLLESLPESPVLFDTWGSLAASAPNPLCAKPMMLPVFVLLLLLLLFLFCSCCFCLLHIWLFP